VISGTAAIANFRENARILAIHFLMPGLVTIPAQLVRTDTSRLMSLTAQKTRLKHRVSRTTICDMAHTSTVVALGGYVL